MKVEGFEKTGGLKAFLAGFFCFFFLCLSSSHAHALLIYELFNNYNKATVYNGPTQPTTFNLDASYQITEIETYHWNSRRGKTPGQIRLVHQDGTIYGPWQATGREGYQGVPNAYWQVHPYVVAKPGNYAIQVSDNDSWSYNSGSGNAGHAKVMGISPGSDSYSAEDIIFNFVEDLFHGQDIFVPTRQQTLCEDLNGYDLCYRQYNNYYGYHLFLVTWQGHYWLYWGEYFYLGTVDEWLTIADYTPSPHAKIKAESISTDPGPVSQISITPYGMFDFIHEGPFTVSYRVTNTGNSKVTKTVTANAFVSFDFGETGHLIGGVHQSSLTLEAGQSKRLTRSFNAVAGGLWTFSLDTEDDSLEYQLLIMNN